MIRIENFHKSFGNKKVHRGITFEVHEGECLGLVGGSGTGKSVLLRSLIGLEKPDQGHVYYRQTEISKLEESDLTDIRKKIAYVFQGGALFDSMTVYENLAYPLREHTDWSESKISDRIHALLDEFGLGGNDQVYPGNLSGGMQKRVGLARSIIMEPEVVLYDEPTAGLDPYNTRKIEEMILKMKRKGKTSVLVTHDMPVAFKVCDRIALLRDGVISSMGKIDEISKREDHIISKFAEGEY